MGTNPPVADTLQGGESFLQSPWATLLASLYGSQPPAALAGPLAAPLHPLSQPQAPNGISLCYRGFSVWKEHEREWGKDSIPKHQLAARWRCLEAGT